MNCLPLHWGSCLPCASAFWASPCKGVPGILFQLTGLRFPHFSLNCPASTNQKSSILTNQDRAFWTNETAKIWSPVCMKMGQSWSRGRDFYLYEPAPLWLGAHVVPSTKDWRLLPWLAETLEIPCQSEAEETSTVKADWQAAELTRATRSWGELSWLSGTWPQGWLTACYITVELFCTE